MKAYSSVPTTSGLLPCQYRHWSCPTPLGVASFCFQAWPNSVKMKLLTGFIIKVPSSVGILLKLSQVLIGNAVAHGRVSVLW